MPEHKSSQVLELDDGVIGEGGSLVTFFTLDANSYMSCLYHVYIVETITDAKSQLLIIE